MLALTTSTRHHTRKPAKCSCTAVTLRGNVYGTRAAPQELLALLCGILRDLQSPVRLVCHWVGSAPRRGGACLHSSVRGVAACV